MASSSALQEAYYEGYNAYVHGASLEDNPYQEDSMYEFYFMWKDGYYAAAADDFWRCVLCSC